MESLSHDELVRRLDDAARRSPGGAVAFDGDGTLWSGDIGEDFYEAARRLVLPSVHPRLVEAARAEGLPAPPASGAVEWIWAEYLAGRFSEIRVCEVLAWMVAGRPRAEVDAFAADLLERVGLRARLQAETLAVLEHARAKGIDVFLVSASPRAVVDAAARVVGIPAANVVAVREIVDPVGMVQPDVERPIPYGPGKVTCLRALLGARPLYAAFGDNAFDVAMLREAEIPVAVRPKERLRQVAESVPGLRVLASG